MSNIASLAHNMYVVLVIDLSAFSFFFLICFDIISDPKAEIISSLEKINGKLSNLSNCQKYYDFANILHSKKVKAD